MNKTTTKLGVITLVAVLAACTAAVTESTEAQAPGLRIEPVVEDVLYNIIGSGGNVAALVTEEGVVLVDDKFEENYEGIVESVSSVTGQPIRYVLNTHYHGDHAGGNTRFLDVAEVISTRNARRNILEGRQSNAPPNMMPARIVFTEEMSLFLGGYEVRARHFGRGHTDTDAIVYFPELDTVHMGDMMAGTTPLIDYTGGGSIAEWTSTVDALLRTFEFDTVIPGHGAVTNREGLETYRANVVQLRDRVTSLVREGRSEAEIGAVLAEEYPSYAPGSLYVEWSLPGFMEELR